MIEGRHRRNILEAKLVREAHEFRQQFTLGRGVENRQVIFTELHWINPNLRAFTTA